jgi:Tfp pilus assembly protein PilF
MRSTLLFAHALVAAALLASCAIGSSTTTRSRTEGAEDEVSMGTSVSVHGNQPDAWLEQARQRARDNLYADAAALLHKVHEAPEATDEQKATGLLELAKLNLNILNPSRSEAKAREFYEQVMREFPDTEQSKTAEERLDLLGPAE